MSRTALFAFALLSFQFAHSQARSYGLAYSENIKGGTTMFGNTLMHILKNDKSVDVTKMNGNSANGNSAYGNNDQNMQFVDVDGTSGNGSVTRNSSTSDLVLPAGTNNIKLARLYWGGAVKTSEYDLTKPENRTIKIRKGTTSTYSDVTALGLDRISFTTGFYEYQAYADITAFVKQNGAGTYSVGNVPLTVGPNYLRKPWRLGHRCSLRKSIAQLQQYSLI